MAIVLLAVLFLLVPAAVPGWADPAPEGRAPGETRASWSVTGFEEREPPLNVLFEDSRVNATYHLGLPNSGTITSASITIACQARYSLKASPTGFEDNPSAGHTAYWTETFTYPPTGNPANYKLNRIDSFDEWTIASIDGTAYPASTSGMNNPPPYRYPTQLFDIKVNRSEVIKLGVDWHGWGE